jgi:hypothetical protein
MITKKIIIHYLSVLFSINLNAATAPVTTGETWPSKGIRPSDPESWVSILSIAAAILAIIFGKSSLKGNSNSKGIIGIVTGGVTLAVILIAIAFFLIYFSGPWM